MESCIHKGLVIKTDTDAGYVYVWVPTGKSAVPDGFSEYLYENTGGMLFGAAYADAVDSAYKCKIASPLTAGAWFRANHAQAGSVFDDYNDTVYPLTIMGNYQTRGNNGTPESYVMNTDVPTASGAVSVNTLSVAGGISTHRPGTLPKGQFPYLEANQWVLIAFIHSSSNPVVIASLHSNEAWNTIKV